LLKPGVVMSQIIPARTEAMNAVRMIYEGGNFRPIDPVNLPEGCPVNLRLIRAVDIPDNRAPIYEFQIERRDDAEKAAETLKASP
jgi:predicted DNA-binding antitoxin AbrB/MazE fold protein